MESEQHKTSPMNPEHDCRDLLLEIGTEELPPKNLYGLAEALATNLHRALASADLMGGKTHFFATPRRLAVLIKELPAVQPDRHQEKRGPALKAAFDAWGNPTRAAEGFARSCGVPVTELTKSCTDKGQWLTYASVEPGAPASEIIPQAVENALAALPIPKRMRWGDRSEEFIRPVHWVVLLLGKEVVPANILGNPTGRTTRGHRFHHPQTLHLADPAAYGPLLETEGRVIADFANRRDAIRAQAEEAAITVGGQVHIDEALLDEVTALVEWPVALVGDFEPRFLEVPAEVLVTTMQDNQKYFPVVDASGRLMPHFITISNIESRDPAQVRAGNERVIRPRFSDAQFFWNQDRETPLASRQPQLQQVVFQHQLGSVYDKCERIAQLAQFIAECTGNNPDWAERAARLSKCDLLTLMVQEFPKLQGTMGRHYAHHDGEPEEIAQALEEQYRPRFAGDILPTTGTGQALALADRLDTLIGIFAIGQAPTGAKDPFALRRAALGVLRILIEGKLPLDLEVLLARGAERFPGTVNAKGTLDSVFEFLMERLRGYYMEQHFRPDTFEAVLDCRPTSPLDFDRRLRALSRFRTLPEAESLAAANKRIRNILRQVEGTLPFEIRTDLLQEEAERLLAGRLAELSSEVIPLLDNGMYSDALTRLSALRQPVDRFFDEVMVMVETADLRNNRIALLNEMESLFLRIANLSQLQG